MKFSKKNRLIFSIIFLYICWVYVRSYMIVGHNILWFRIDFMPPLLSLPIECIYCKYDMVYCSIGADKVHLAVGENGFIILDIRQGDNYFKLSSLEDGYYAYNTKRLYLNKKNYFIGWSTDTVWLKIDTRHIVRDDPGFMEALRKLKEL